MPAYYNKIKPSLATFDSVTKMCSFFCDLVCMNVAPGASELEGGTILVIFAGD